MSGEVKKLKSSLKKPKSGVSEGVNTTQTVGQYNEPLSLTSTEQTCNFENFWRALFCFGGPPLPDADLPRNFKEFRTDSARVNSFTNLASSRSDEIDITEFHGSSRNPPKRVQEDPEEKARKEKEVAELKSLLEHHTEERLKVGI